MLCKLADALSNKIRKGEAVLTGDPNSGQQEVDTMEIKTPGRTVHVYVSFRCSASISTSPFSIAERSNHGLEGPGPVPAGSVKVWMDIGDGVYITSYTSSIALKQSSRGHSDILAFLLENMFLMLAFAWELPEMTLLADSGIPK